MRVITGEMVSTSGITQMDRAIGLVEACFQAKYAGLAVSGREVSLKPHGPEGGAFYSLPAYHKKLGLACLKWTSHVSSSPSRAYTQPVILLSDLNTGTPLALIDGYEISALRTGGVTGVALKLLARSDTERLLCCGAGHQAHSQLRASVAVLPALKHVAVWSRTILRASKFCGKLEAEFGPNPVFQPVSDFEEYVGTADVIMGVTSASSPYLHKRHFKDGQLYFHIGMNDVSRGAIKSFDKIVCDDFEAGRDGSSQSLFRLYRDEPDIAGRVISLESLLCHGAPRRPSLGKRVMFDSFGLPVFDLVLAAEVYRHAIDNGLGWDASLNSCSEGSEQ